MSSTEEDDKFFVLDLENEAVAFVDMHTPPTRKIAFERFRLANATIAVSVNALKKGVDAFCHSGVNRNDFAELFPSPVVPDFLHADNFRTGEIGEFPSRRAGLCYNGVVGCDRKAATTKLREGGGGEIPSRNRGG